MSYVTVQEYQDWIARLSNGGQSVPTADLDLYQLFLDDAQDWLEEKTQRWYEGRTGTRLFDSSNLDSEMPGRLLLDADLLSVTELINGDGNVIPPTAYRLWPYNVSPKWGIFLPNQAWNIPINGIISVTGSWGYSNSPSATVRRMVKRVAWSIQSTRTAGSSVTQLPDGTRLFESSLPPDIYAWIKSNRRDPGIL